MEKDYFRKIIKDKRNLMDEVLLTEVAYNNRLIADKYLKTNFYNNSSIIFAYASFKKELSLQNIIDKALNDGKKVALPKVITGVKSGALMDFVFIDKNTKFGVSSYGIKEPVTDEIVNIYEINDNIEMIIPGLCFDLNGNRIGYGGGYFDRYLTRFSKDKFHITALAYDYQIFESLPVNDYDKQVDLIVTENRYIKIDTR